MAKLPDANSNSQASVTVLNSVKAVAPPARFRKRHLVLATSFLLGVILPSLAAFVYLYTVAADQYSSRVSFSIRSEEFQNPLDALGSLGQLSTGTSSDASILNEYIRSQKLLEDISENIDLQKLYSRPDYDPVFAFREGQPIEDLLSYWQWMTYISYDAGTGLIDIEAFAFSPENAREIATAVMQASSKLVNELSNIAREDTTKHAEFELERAQERLAEAREKLRALRDKEQIVDPRIDLESQMGVLTALQTQLATKIIEYDLLIGTTREDDPRVIGVGKSIKVIEKRIAEEREKIGKTTSDSEREALSSIVGDFEGLLAEREFAEQAYLAAAASYDAALAEARRKSRYLAAHIPPTFAQSAQYPQRFLLGLGVLGTCLLIWSILVLTVYSAMDRR